MLEQVPIFASPAQAREILVAPSVLDGDPAAERAPQQKSCAGQRAIGVRLRCENRQRTCAVIEIERRGACDKGIDISLGTQVSLARTDQGAKLERIVARRLGGQG